ncbi:UDP-glucose:glycoprotein glucosyltransferase 2 [Erpetoichthys calabaricus]|uniref:UDP-glucose:glycoprotein glucosyltransferase 2 n=1 Tax=Erpetoichthys calabaricus TaxID=27687 RepID=UPI002234B6D7|nr:UDP-glucose:glycoprotein glucosyltransferase 2 [Erpetoichthys calabaricus]
MAAIIYPSMSLLLCLGFLLPTVLHCDAASKGVTVSLKTKWPMTPLLLETSEFIAQEGNEMFWQFVDTVREITIYKKDDSEQAYYNLILKKAGQFITDLQINLLKFALSLRVFSPTVQKFQQMAADEPPPESCSAFISVHGKLTCSPNEIKKLLKKAASRPRPYLFQSDHRFPAFNQDNLPVVILYAEVGTSSFNAFHKILSEKSGKGEILYVLRHYTANPRLEKINLSGYGVELAIKDTEYRAVDDSEVTGSQIPNATIPENEDEIDDVQGFLFGQLKNSYPYLKEQLGELRKHLIESANEIAPLKVWELQDLSFQAAALITSARKYDALKIMRDLSQNFPIKARSLTRVAVNTELRKEIEENQKHLTDTLGIQPGEAGFFINGYQIELDTTNPFSILDRISSEAKVMEGLYGHGFKEDNLNKMLKQSVHSVKDSFALDIRHPAVLWINDIEKDSMYSSWPSSCQELLRPTFPGVMRQIRRNFFNLVLFINPAQEHTNELHGLAQRFLKHSVPLRIGLVFIINSSDNVDGHKDVGVALFRIINYLTEEYDTSLALSFMFSVYSGLKSGEVLTIDKLIKFLNKKYPRANVDTIIGSDSPYDNNRKDGGAFYKKSGLGPLPQILFNGLPFIQEALNLDDLEIVTMQHIMDSTNFIQKAVLTGEMTDEMDALQFLMKQSNVVSRMNPLILSSKKEYLDLTSKPALEDWQDFVTFSFLDSRDKSAVVMENMKYLTNHDKDIIYAVTIWIIADFDKPSGRRLLSNALKHMKKSTNIRIGLLNNPESKGLSDDNTVVARATWSAILTQKQQVVVNFIQKLIKEETQQRLHQGTKMKYLVVQGMDSNSFEKMFNTLGVDFIKSQQLFCRDVLHLLPGQMAIVTNGRILGPLDESKDFDPEDFHLLEKLSFDGSAENIRLRVKQMGIKGKQASDLVMKVDALLTSLPREHTRRDIQFIKNKLSVIHQAPREDEVYFDVIVIVDPLTRQAQKVAHLLIVLGQVINMKLQVFMNCKSKLSEMPLKSFYRLVLEPDIIFLANKRISAGPVAHFIGLPEAPLLTLNMITPENWLVEAVRSSYDLDNIHLKEIDGLVRAEYELGHLLLEGHCFDATTGQPPRGLQFTLGVKNNLLIQDTIVMANLGYFQLKANPGAWMLKLRKGRSEDLYQIVLCDGADLPPNADNVIVVLENFLSKIIKVQVHKKPHKIGEEILGDESEEQITMSFEEESNNLEKKNADVLNVFSVASGHLYERFLRIMMLSVLRHTKTPVKFWFLKNYLSPTFKETIPHMAQAYGFQYELVQYMWPHWLHQQTEKQRIIWGYKILFLDVLFPLAVDKIIFVDADQIVKADLKELRDFNLSGAPYGYTPFCDSRKEMDGYRFWKSGYWASHLGKRKYHISALYVVDLKKFRKIAAGDRLRGQYQALSQDPNSLSNLDQDLPNNMIHQVAIKSLPQEWLWCETWCDDQSKTKAKTIDLCNNPKTKEPKLKAAMRIVPEWTEYDEEIKQLLKQAEGQKKRAKSKSKKNVAHNEL